MLCDRQYRFAFTITEANLLDRFFNTELGWDQTKVDDLLLPIIRKMNKRSQVRPSKFVRYLCTLC